jgi:uncharacterized protein YkwD
MKRLVKKGATVLAAATLALGAAVNTLPVQASGFSNSDVKFIQASNYQDFQEYLQQCYENGNQNQWDNINVIWANSDCEIPNDGSGTYDNQTPADNTDQGNDTTNENPGSQSDDAFITQVVSLVNQERAKEGLSPLTIDAKIENGAMVRAKEIQQNFDHTRPNGSSFATALTEAGASFRGAGENIAWGQRTPQEVVNTWMNSPGHRANIMERNFSRIGVGHLNNNNTDYWVQLFAN